VRGADERETVVSNERLELTGPRGQSPRDVAPDEGRFHEEGRNHDVPYGSPSGSVLLTRCPSGGPSGQTFRGVSPEKK